MVKKNLESAGACLGVSPDEPVFAGTSHYAAHVFVCCRDFLPAEVAATSSCRDLLPDELCLFPGEECLVDYRGAEQGGDGKVDGE
jgi:hypothetical protein